MLPLIELSAKDFLLLEKELRADEREFKAGRRKAMVAATDLAVVEIQHRIRATFKKGTGNYVESIARKVTGKGDRLEGRVFIEKLGYYAVHETGKTIVPSRYAEITIKRQARRGLDYHKYEKTYLAFKVDGHWVRVKQVRIPPRKVWGPASVSIQPEVEELMGTAFAPFLRVRSA